VSDLAALGGVVAHWAPAGRRVRPGTWQEQAVPTPDAIDAALAAGRRDDAAALVRHLVVEAQEIHDLWSDWAREIPLFLGAELDVAGAERAEREWLQFTAAAESFAGACEEDRVPPAGVEGLLDVWRTAHDRHLRVVADLVDTAVRDRGEACLGDLWRHLQRDGIQAYGRYDTAATPWPESFALLVQIAIEGMHGHPGGPARRGEVTVEETDERVSLTFAPCGSGGRVLAEGEHGVMTTRQDFAWNEIGVCHYCIHCCVLQQLEPIDRLGHPARVIDPPLRPGDSCTWTVYRDPALVPDEAYRRVGRTPPSVSR
jgi:hypothetical protein